MRLICLSHSYVPSRRADSVQVMRMAEAWAGQGHDVVLATKHCPPRQEPGTGDDWEFYGVRASFELDRLPRPAWRGGGLVFQHAVRRLVRREGERTDLFYCRDLGAAAHVARRGLPFAFEAHVPPGTRRLQRLLRKTAAAASCRGIVVISDALGLHLRSTGLVPAGATVFTAPDGAPAPDLRARPIEPAQLEGGRPRIGYVGQLYPGKGLETLLDLATAMPWASVHVLGGEAEALAGLRAARLPGNLRLHGFIEPRRLPEYYAAFDLVVMPYGRQVSGASARSDLSRWMSPMKMFEYMAAGKPIVSSDLPVLREVLTDGENCLLVPPGDTEAWVAAISRLAGDAALAASLGDRARHDLVTRFTWEARARRILEELGVDGP